MPWDCRQGSACSHCASYGCKWPRPPPATLNERPPSWSSPGHGRVSGQRRIVLAVGVDAAAAATGGVHGLAPALTSFVGRTSDARKLDGLLGEYRLVTVTGPGGVGKTRLACEVARRAGARFADGVWLVELAALQNPALVPAAVANVLGISQSPGSSLTQTLAGALSRRQLLLVLDNCEHVLDAAAELCGGLLPVADDMVVLATSREPMGIAGETRYRLSPLPVPGSGPAGQGPGSAAVQLFAERARQADPSFELAGGAAMLVERLVTRLDGVPLAIELAAARLEALGLSQLLDRLDLLVGGDRRALVRQQSLAATIGWSYQLLTEDMRRAFRQLAIFPGPFSLEAAEDVIGVSAGSAVVHLVDCSLLSPPRAGPDGRSRYAMLDTIRAFGRVRLAEAGEEHETATALARYAVMTADSAAAGLQTSTGELAAGRWLDAEASATEQALAWSLEHDHASAARLAAALGPWWILRARSADADQHLRAAAVLTEPGSDLWCRLQVLLGEVAEESSLERALTHYSSACDAAAERGPSPILADALDGRAHTLVLMFRLEEGAQVARVCHAMSRELGYLARVASSLTILGDAAFHAGRSGEAVSWYRQAGQVDPARIPGTLSRMCGLVLTNGLRRTGDSDEALRTCTNVLFQAVTADDLPAQASARILMADLERQAGQVAAGAAHLSESLRLYRQTGNVMCLPDCLEICGHLCADRGRWADAVTAWSAATALLRTAGMSDTPLDADARRPRWQKAAQMLGAVQMRAAEQRGAGMAADTAAEFALVLTADDLQPRPVQAEISQLSTRERELVTLVAQGRTDAQIAGQLYIAVSTVRSHLDRIRDKTGSRRRADLTRLALQAGLV
jgi:predicted ATPase/DNA-binding CsgD family transcriptional regulator